MVAHVLNNGAVNGSGAPETGNITENAASTYTLGLGTFISSTESNALQLLGTGVWTVKIDGGIYTDTGIDDNEDGNNDGRGLVINNIAAANNKITVGVDGSIGGSEVGFATSATFDLINAGTIVGHGLGITLFNDPDFSNPNAVGKKVSIDNKVDAVIGADFLGIANGTFATMTVKNAGIISGGQDYYYDTNLDQIDDTGFTGAAIDSRGALVFSNALTGQVGGGITSGWFGSKVDNAGLIEGTIQAYVENNNGIADLDRDGDFADQATGGAIAVSALTQVVSTINNKGTIVGFEDYGLNNQDTAGTEDDEYFQVAMSLSDGKDVVTNSGRIYGDVWLNQGDDSFTNTGFVRGFVDGWKGNNTIVNKGIIEYGVGSEEGSDKLDNGGEIHGNVRLGAGADTLNNSGEIWDNVDLGDGNNTMTNKGKIFDFVGAGANDDTVTNSGLIGGDDFARNFEVAIDLGGGNDKLTNTGRILGGINLGAGNDIFVGGKTNEDVLEANGLDNYNLGAGDDLMVFFNEDGQIDTADGGAGVDTLDLTEMDQLVTVNLALNQLNIGGTVNVIKNFEVVEGSDFADTLTGGLLRDTLYGNAGADLINGGKGKDNLYGGDGADKFIYTALTDSTASNAGRDIIWDFEQGVDKIQLDLAGIDIAGALVENAAFTGAANQLRYVQDGYFTKVELDTNGDKKADFAIVIADNVSLTAGDFILL
jgi:serralysin